MMFYFYLLLISFPFDSITGFFRRNPSFIRSFKREIPIEHTLGKEMNGFYGLIGPNIDIKTTKTMYDLFLGNGMVQGVFIENNKLTFIKNDIQTDKRRIEDSVFLEPKPYLPNMMGVANTAFFHFKNNTYALFERDQPYMIDIDFQKKIVNTIEKKTMDDISHFCAHPKIRDSFIETIDYDILQKRVKIYQLDEYFRVLSTNFIPMKYLPMIHDFISTPNSMIILNSPFIADISILPRLSATIKLDVTKSSIFYITNRENGKVQRYYVNQAIYIFHYADVYETDTEIEIYAPIHDSLDFSKINFKGKYRKVIINKKTQQVDIERNPELEGFDIEFPVPFYHENKKKILMRYLDNVKMDTGFIICERLNLEKRIHYPNRRICGEPSIVYKDEVPHALFFTIDNMENGYFHILNLVTEDDVEIPINEKIKIGFHAIFLQSP